MRNYYSLPALKSLTELNMSTESEIASDERPKYKSLCQFGTDSNKGKIHELVRVMWQSEKWKQILEKGTMWSRRWWKTCIARKFVSAGFLTCWQRRKTTVKKVSSQWLEWKAVESNDFLHKIVTGSENWFHHFDPEIEWHRMEWYHTTLPKKEMTTMSSVHMATVTILECWKMHTGWVFAARGNHQCCSLCSDAPGALSSTEWKMSREEDDHPTIRQCKAPHCSFVYWEDSEEWLGCSPHPPYRLDLAPLDYQLFKVVKYQMCNQWCSLCSHLSSYKLLLKSSTTWYSSYFYSSSKNSLISMVLCREANKLHRFDWCSAFLFIPLCDYEIICSWLLVQPS